MQFLQVPSRYVPEGQFAQSPGPGPVQATQAASHAPQDVSVVVVQASTVYWFAAHTVHALHVVPER